MSRECDAQQSWRTSLIEGFVAGQEGTLDREFRKCLSGDLGLRFEYREGASWESNLERHFSYNMTKTLRQKSSVSVRHRKKASVAGTSWEKGEVAWDHVEEAGRGGCEADGW